MSLFFSLHLIDSFSCETEITKSTKESTSSPHSTTTTCRIIVPVSLSDIGILILITEKGFRQLNKTFFLKRQYILISKLIF